MIPVRAAVGTWNAKGIDPDELFSTFKPWLQTLMLTINEVRPSKDEFHATSAYNILKPMIAAPPDTLTLNDKYAKLRYVRNLMRVFITTNDWLSMYVPAEDRRMFIMHSNLQQKWHIEDGDPHYFDQMFEWLEVGGGNAAVAVWLKTLDISDFNPKAQVERTAGWERVVAANGEPDDALSAALDGVGRSEVFFGKELLDWSFDHSNEIRAMLSHPQKLSHRMNRAGYAMYRPTKNPEDKTRWQFKPEGKIYPN